ncbi:MAG TPA: hypothetical protein VM735_09980 [Candidatus Kapabacteria bacterium]|nr:hypothetical protein [Candidatus Kapabacteria bacterium]
MFQWILTLLAAALFCSSVLADRIELKPFLIATNENSKTYRFPRPLKLAALLQQNGTDDFVLRNGPILTWWEGSTNGVDWIEIPGTRIGNHRRVRRLARVGVDGLEATHVRIHYEHGVAEGEAAFDGAHRSLKRDWILIVNSTDDRSLPGHGKEFVPLARSVHGRTNLAAQQVWVGDFSRTLVEAEPRPLAVFFSGSFKDWCEVDRADWHGVEDVLRNYQVPIWASCGGAQALAIISEYGVRSEWDCPHCRQPGIPKTPIYTHIGHNGDLKKCGDYSGCIFERGPHNVRIAKSDAVFANLPDEFEVMQSHCGQIEFPPAGWELIGAGGAGSKTKVQCIKKRDLPVYAAQFHIEMEGTPEVSRQIMENFLNLAERSKVGLR